MLSAVTAHASEKLIDTVLYSHDPSPDGVYRWSEAALLNLDDKQHLMMHVTAFGHGGHDHTSANILESHSYDGGLTWTSLDKVKVFQKNISKDNVMSPTLLRL